MKSIVLIAFTSLVVAAAAGCGSSGDSGSSRPGFGKTGSSGGSGSGGTSSGGSSGGATGVGGGSQSGDIPGTGPGDPSTPIDPGSNGPPSDPNAPCNDITNDGTAVTVQSGGSSMPSATGGGAPLDGHYLLTQVQHYGFSSSNDSYQGTLFISSGLQQYVVSKNGTETRSNFLADYTGTALTLSARCGASDETLSYTAPSETQIVIYDATNKLAYTYTRPDPAGN